MPGAITPARTRNRSKTPTAHRNSPAAINPNPPSDSHARKVAEEKVKATYEVAKEKCDDQKGDAKAACVKQAKADEAQGKADIKAMKKKTM